MAATPAPTSIGTTQDAMLTSAGSMLRVLPTMRSLELDGDVGGEQEQGAVGHVDRAHQAEDQGEPGRDHEHQAGKGDPVEEGDEELAGLIDRCTGRRTGGEEQHPTEHEHDRHAHRNGR